MFKCGSTAIEYFNNLIVPWTNFHSSETDLVCQNKDNYEGHSETGMKTNGG